MSCVDLTNCAVCEPLRPAPCLAPCCALKAYTLPLHCECLVLPTAQALVNGDARVTIVAFVDRHSHPALTASVTDMPVIIRSATVS